MMVPLAKIGTSGDVLTRKIVITTIAPTNLYPGMAQNIMIAIAEERLI